MNTFWCHPWASRQKDVTTFYSQFYLRHFVADKRIGRRCMGGYWQSAQIESSSGNLSTTSVAVATATPLITRIICRCNLSSVATQRTKFCDARFVYCNDYGAYERYDTIQRRFFFAARRYASAAYVVMRCLSVRLSVRVSVTFVHSVKRNKHIFKNFSPPF